MTEEQAQPEFKKSNKERYLKIGLGAMVILTAGILILIRLNSPETQLRWLIIPGAFVLLLAILVFFWGRIHALFAGKSKEDTEEKVPEPISQETMLQTIKNMNWSKEFENNFKMEKIHPWNFNKNEVYEIVCSSPHMDEIQKGTAHVFINANYPSKTPAIEWDLIQKRNVASAIANRMSKSPVERDEDTTETRRDPLTGEVISREVRKTRRVMKAKKKGEEET